jgi:hypothetical protein
MKKMMSKTKQDWEVKNVRSDLTLLKYKNYTVKVFWAWSNAIDCYAWSLELFKGKRYLFGAGATPEEKQIFKQKLQKLGLPPLPSFVR